MKISVVILARNEKDIDQVIESLLNQTKPTFEIIIVDDGTTDGSLIHAILDYDVIVVKYPHDHESWVIDPRLSRVVNFGLSHCSKHSDYYCILGGDHILQPFYFEKMISVMVKQNIQVSSGMISGESLNVRGSGRIISNKVFKEQNFEYPCNYGYETYLLFKALHDGNIVKSLPIHSGYVSRSTGTNYSTNESYIRGKAYRALGYGYGYSIIMAIKKYRKIPLILNFIRGYHTLPNEDQYDQKVRGMIYHYQIKRLLHLVKPL
jgi:glycosyltransferase involved in cell wall biosynthesis